MAPGERTVHQWETLEDLALMDEKASEPYRHVLAEKGHEEMARRKAFLEIV